MIRRLLVALAAMGVLYFAIEGGQWGTYDLWKQRRQKQRVQAELDSLQRTVDSLRQYRARLANDRALQEKLAREKFGMVRGDKELLYLIAPGDSAGRARREE